MRASREHLEVGDGWRLGVAFVVRTADRRVKDTILFASNDQQGRSWARPVHPGIARQSAAVEPARLGHDHRVIRRALLRQWQDVRPGILELLEGHIPWLRGWDQRVDEGPTEADE